MIDDYAKAMALVKKMKASLPIPVRATGELVRALKQYGAQMVVSQELAITSVIYMGDEGGIMCDVTPLDMGKTPVVCSLTHLAVVPGHPLAVEMRDYQVARARKLAPQRSKPTSYTIKPRKRKR
ncbi:MAG: hypothetical protein CVU38_13020 [Chloroflexi bacterium HGW-Chloroflexi-1]|nr:MAG: hypothetical protein CVU38_13020 [Chloroflexi bacterium HGW-Chloroflexi-1]